MTKKDVWFIVDKKFLGHVQAELTRLHRKLQDSYKEPPEKAIRIMRAFTYYHPIGGIQEAFFSNYYRTNLIAKHKDDPTKVMMFGFLRTIFLGILRGAPRTRVFTRRVRKYKETYRLAYSLEEFLSLYRRRVGFKKRELPREIYLESGTKSECKDLPEYACMAPRCRFIKTVRKGKPVEYCTRHESRRRGTSMHNKTRRRSKNHQ
jgi:hypothetical protein